MPLHCSLFLNFVPPENDSSPAVLQILDCYLKAIAEPFVCALGFVLNAFCLLLFLCVNWRHKNAHSELLPYLAGLCFFDAMQNALSILVLDVQGWATHLNMLYPSTPENWTPLKSFSAVTMRYCGPVLMTVNFASIWTITAIAIERHRAICNPFGSVPRRQNPRRSRCQAWIIVACIFVAALILNWIRWWESKLYVTTMYSEASQRNISYTDIDYTQLGKSMEYTFVMNKVMYTAVVYCMPFVLLTALNSRILCSLYSVPTMQLSAAQITFHTRHRELRSAWMLITIIVLFFSCHTGGLVLRFVDGDWIAGHYTAYYFLADASNFLFNVNALLNPVVYFLFTRQFRDFWRLSFGPPTTELKKSAQGIAAAALVTLMAGGGVNSQSAIIRRFGQTQPPVRSDAATLSERTMVLANEQSGAEITVMPPAAASQPSLFHQNRRCSSSRRYTFIYTNHNNNDNVFIKLDDDGQRARRFSVVDANSGF